MLSETSGSEVALRQLEVPTADLVVVRIPILIWARVDLEI